MKFSFRPFSIRMLFCALAMLSAGCATQQPQPVATHAPMPAPAIRAVKPMPLLLISIDGYRADYLERGLSPTLAMLAKSGVRAASMQPSFPSLTFPNHYTLVTGLRPDHHGIVNNSMSDAQLGKFSLGNRAAVSDGRWWSQGTPLWETAGLYGLKSATMFWPGSEADIHGKHPDYWKPYDGKVTPTQRVEQILAWLDLPAEQRPSFLTLYFDAVDHANHEYGPDAPEVRKALRETDAALALLVQGLKQRQLFDHINLIVVSDHGIAKVPRKNVIMFDKLIPLAQVETVSLGVLAGFNPKSSDAASMQSFAKLTAKLEEPQNHMQCWDKSRVPTRLVYGSNPRVPQLLCLADVGWHFSSTSELAKRKGKLSLGEHGYDNIDTDMQATFVAHGPAFLEGIQVKAFPNVDVYPLMIHLLGLPPAPSDGDFDAVKGMLK
ncbi:ectonucleotide pyrophosphatase/phosphodiesterase [Dyella silvatica]|uniref:alkaline phosphatase family protein n=1 Tax=Dyella silvatica TaxID=2992128 RepID=UPI00225261FA|nr:alkaline phosphatase family protein [Dyella silvatica]